MTITMFENLDAFAHEAPHHGHECGAHDDPCDDTCSLAAAVIPAVGLE